LPFHGIVLAKKAAPKLNVVCHHQAADNYAAIISPYILKLF